METVYGGDEGGATPFSADWAIQRAIAISGL